MQKLGNSHVVPMNGSGRHRRPRSAASAGRPTSAGVGGASVGGANKPRVDAKFIADADLWDPATPHESYRQKRPTSAPVYKRSLSLSLFVLIIVIITLLKSHYYYCLFICWQITYLI